MASITIRDEAHWKSVRAKHIGASEISALFGLSPWLTRWQLYMLKTGRLPDVFESTSMTQGKHFEPAIAAYAQEKFGINLRKVKRYLTRDTVPGMGASLDYEEYGSGALIPTEIKWSLYGDGWEYESDELTAIPDYYFMQCQHQMACADAQTSQLIAFTGGDLKRMIIPRDERLISAIEDAVRQFWDDVANNREPPVDFSVDADSVARLAHVSKLRTLTIPTTDPDAGLFEVWQAAQAEAKRYDTVASEARARILKRVIDAGEGNDESVRVTCGDWSVSIAKIADNAGKQITPDMIGETIGARKGYLRTTLKNTTQKKEKK